MKCFVAIVIIFVFAAVVTARDIGANPRDIVEAYSHTKLKREVTKDPLPNLVKIGYKSPYGWIYGCSGAIIGPRKILTSTSCFTTKSFNADSEIVQLGNQEFKVTKIITKDEVAVLLLEIAINLVNNPICLSSNSYIQTGIVAGWGGLLFDNILHATTNKEMSQSNITVFKISKGTMEVHGSECIVDRGGALLVTSATRGCSHEIIGVLRDWKNCGENGSFGTYIILTNYNTWIESL